MPSAIVTGATGLLGREIVFRLAQDKTWTTVYALSRSQKEEYPPQVKHSHIDLTDDAKQMAEQLNGVQAEYVFFAAYLAKDSEEELAKVNGSMLQSFLDALTASGAIKTIKRFILVTGCKQYALQFGRPKLPMLEDAPRIDGPDWPPNFYYVQQDIVRKAASQHGFDWVVTYPNDVIGLATQNFMNLALPLVLYATVNAELTGSLPWPGSAAFYTKFTSFTSAKLHADFCLWAATTPRCANQAFNVVNGDAESWQNLWPRLAARYRCTVPPDMLAAAPDNPSLSTSVELNAKPPLSVVAADLGLDSDPYTAPSKLDARVNLSKWAHEDSVRAAWRKIAQRDGLDASVWDKATWDFLTFVLGRDFDVVVSMSKAREYGWTGYRDTWQALQESFGELEAHGVVPKAGKVVGPGG